MKNDKSRVSQKKLLSQLGFQLALHKNLRKALLDKKID